MKDLSEIFNKNYVAKPWIEKGRKEIIRTPIFSLESVERESEGGKKGTFVRLDSPDWVLVLPIFRSREGQLKFVLERQFRHGSGKMAIEFPGGIVEDGEKSEDAARRELMEETGLSCSLLHLGTVSPNAAFMSNKQSFYLAYDLKPERRQDLDENEEIDLLTLDVDETIASMGEEEYGNGIMMMALGYFLRWREKNQAFIQAL